MLDLLAEVRDDIDLDLRAAHFDHGLREGSRAEAARLSEYCRSLGVPCLQRRASGLRPRQNELREARYRFLREAAAGAGAETVALAHTMDDQRETVLINMMRGSGFRGCAGMRERSGILARPVLGFTRRSLRQHLGSRSIRWTTDPANSDPVYRRVRVRASVDPALSDASGGAWAAAAQRLARDCRTVDDALEARTAELLRAALGRDGTCSAEAWKGVAVSDQARMLRQLARNRGRRLTRRSTLNGVAFLGKGSPGSVDLGGGLRLHLAQSRGGRLWLEAAPADGGPG